MKKTEQKLTKRIRLKELPNIYESLFPQYKNMRKKEKKRIRKIVDNMIIEPNETEPQLFN